MVNPLVERATSDMLIGPDWAMNLEICDMLNHEPGQTREVVSGIKKKLNSRSSKVQLLALTLLETLINNCGELIHMQVAEKDILRKMVKMVKRKPNIQVKEKILLLIDLWQETFSGPQGRHPQYYAAYQELLRTGVIFPRRAPRPQATSNSGQISQNSRQDTVDESEFPTLSLTEIQNARGIMDVLAEMVNALDQNNKEGLKQEVIVDLVSQCRTYKQRVVHLVNSTSDESLLCQGLTLNDDLQRLLAKHEAIASGNITSEKEKNIVKDSDQIIDISPRAIANGGETKKDIINPVSNGVEIDLLSGDAFGTPKSTDNNNNSLAIVPVGPPQPNSPVATTDNSLVLIDMLSDNNCDTSSPRLLQQQQQQQQYSNGFGPIHQEQTFQASGSASGSSWKLQISSQHQQPSSPNYGHQPFSTSFSPPMSPHYGGENNNVLALPPPPWEAQSPSSSLQYPYPPPPPPPHQPMQLTQLVITTHTHQPQNNNFFNMCLPPIAQGHVSPFAQQPYSPIKNPYFTNPESIHNQNGYGNQMLGYENYGQIQAQQQQQQQQNVEQQMYGMSIQEINGNSNWREDQYQVSQMMKPVAVNKKPDDKLFGDLVELSKFKNSATAPGRAGSM